MELENGVLSELEGIQACWLEVTAVGSHLARELCDRVMTKDHTRTAQGSPRQAEWEVDVTGNSGRQWEGI